MIEAAALVVPLIISFGMPYAIALGRAPGKGDDYASFTAGLYAGHVVINSTGAAACVQIDFTPLGAYRFFGLPMHELAAHMIHLDDLPDAEIAVLRHRLEDMIDWKSRLDLAEAFVADRLQRGRAVSTGVASAYRELAFCHATCASKPLRGASIGAASICPGASTRRLAFRPSKWPASCASTGCSPLRGARKHHAGPGWPPNVAMPTRRT